MADKAYGSWENREYIADHDANFCIPPKTNAVDPWYCDYSHYKVSTFPYKTEKNRTFPGPPHGKTEIFRKNYDFSTFNGQKGEKIPF